MRKSCIAILSILTVMVVSMLTYFGLGILGFSGILAFAVGATLAGETVTVQKAKELSTIDEDFVSQQIVVMKPTLTPLDTIMRSAGRKIRVDSFKTEYYAVDTRSLKDTVKVAYTSSGDGDLSKAIEVNLVSMWNADDTVLSKGVAGKDGGDATFVILSIDAPNSKITLQPLNGLDGSGTTAGKIILPSLPQDTVLVRMGNVKFETDAQTSPFAILPAKDYNYCQIFMAQVEQSLYQRMHGKEVPWNFSDMEALNIYDMRATMELSWLFGSRTKFTDIVTLKEKYTTGGVKRFITKALEYGTGGADRTITKPNLIDYTKEIFCGNSGSDTRILFSGNVLAASLMKINDVTKNLDAGSTEVKWGITFRKIETNFGVLYVKHHSLFDLVGESDNGIILDVNNIEKHIFKPTSVQTLDLKSPGIKLADANVISECSSLIVRYPDTHALLKPKT